MKHKHHIIPKHMGGTDDPSNLIELTIEEHAKAHKKLWEEHGKKEDWLAWQGLAGLMTKEEIVQQLLSEGGKKGGAKSGGPGVGVKGGKANWEKNKETITKTLQENARKNKEMKEKTGRGLGGNPVGKYQWITDGKMNKKVSIDSMIPEGFSQGRTKLWKTGYSSKPKEKVTCPHCNKIGGKPAMKRYHFDNCKQKDKDDA